MALVRGAKSKFPCPVCLVPAEGMCTGALGTLRTAETMKQVYHEAEEMETEEREKLLKSHGLRYVMVCWMSFHYPSTHTISCVWQNVFWGLKHSDPYRALSFDRLHAFHLGLFKGHIWGALKEEITAAGRLVIKKVDNLYGQFTSTVFRRSKVYTF